MVWSLALCPNDAKQDPMVYGAEYSVVSVPGEESTYYIHTYRRASIASAFTIRILRESATFG